MNSISIIGTGYVGLVTGTCLSEFGLNVICMDTDSQKIRDLELGKVPIYEPGLPTLITKNVSAGRLRFTTDMATGAKDSQVIFLAVPIPPEEDGSADLQHIIGAADCIAQHMTDYKVIAALGLAFKQGTDDVRESSSIPIILELIKKGCQVKAFDPQAMENAINLAFANVDGITYCADEYDAVSGADALVILTEWNQFRHLDLKRLAGTMRGKYFFDFRNIHEPEDVARLGFHYESVGRPKA